MKMNDEPQMTALARKPGSQAERLSGALLGVTPDTLPEGCDRRHAVFGQPTTKSSLFTHTVSDSVVDMERRVDDLANSYVDEWAPLSPVGATYVGIEGYDDKLDDLSIEGYEALAELDRRTLTKLNSIEPDRRPGVRRQGGDEGTA